MLAWRESIVWQRGGSGRVGSDLGLLAGFCLKG